MRIHTDALDYLGISGSTPPETYIDKIEEHGSRKRARSFDVALRGNGTRHTRYANTGTRGADSDGITYSMAATWDDWGLFLAALFELDPEAVAGPYDGRDGFHSQTANCYRGLLLVRARRQGGRAMSAPSFTETVEAQGWDDGTIQTLLHDFIASRGLDEEFRAYAAEVAADENTQAVEMGWS